MTVNFIKAIESYLFESSLLGILFWNKHNDKFLMTGKVKKELL